MEIIELSNNNLNELKIKEEVIKQKLEKKSIDFKKKINLNKGKVIDLDSKNVLSECEDKKSLQDSKNNFFNLKSNAYFQDLILNHNKKKRKNFLEKKCKTWLIVIYYLLSTITNIISVILFIVDNQIAEQKTTNMIIQIDFCISIFFSIEFILSFLKSVNKLSHFLKWETIIDLLTIIPSYINYFSNNGLNLSFIRIFRVLRVLRVLRLLKYVNMLKSDDDDESNSALTINKVKKQIITFIVSLISTIFVSAGIVLILQNNVKNSFSKSDLTFIDAVYFVIVTSSTIGYGDIVPTNTYSRMLVVILLIFLIYFFSEQIASIVSLLRNTDNSPISYDFENHIIIIGDLSAEKIKSFLNDFYDIYNFNNSLKSKPFTIILLDEKNSSIKENLLLEPYENKVHFLLTKNYSIEAFLKCNFEEADSIICLNQNYKSNPWVTDNINDFTLKNIKDFNKSNSMNLIKKKLYLQSLILNQKIMSCRLMPILNIQVLNIKSCLIAKSIYCNGFLTFITNLVNTNIPQIKNKNHFLTDYIEGMKNSLVIQNFPKKLIGIEYGVLFREIYFRSVNKYPSYYSSNRINNECQNSINKGLTNTVPSKDDENKYFEKNSKNLKMESNNSQDSPHITGIILFGIFVHKDDVQNDIINKEVGINLEKIMFNPPKDYKISDLDSGIFITSMTKENIYSFLLSIDLKDEKIENCKKSENISKYLSSYFKDKFMMNYEYITDRHIKLKFLDPSLRIIEAELFSANFPNQIMIFGCPFYIDDIICKIRAQNLHHPIIVLSENFDEDIKQKIIKNFSNVYLILGDFLDLNTLENVRIENSSFVVILSTENINTTNEDSNAVLAARIIEQYFQIPYIVEVYHRSNSRFLGSLPIHNESLPDEINEYIYPNYMQGKILFSSFIDKLLPRSFTSIQEVLCLQELIENDFKSQNEVLDYDDENKDHDIRLYQQIEYNFFSIKVPSYLIGNTYYHLFDELTSLKEIHVPLGIYGKSTRLMNSISLDVNEYCEKCSNCKNYELNSKNCLNCSNCNKKKESNKKVLLDKYLHIINNEIKNNVLEYVFLENITTPLFITNPPIDFILEKDMEILVFGRFVKFNFMNGEKANLKRMSKFDKISDNIKNISHKKNLLKKLEKNLHNRIIQIDLENFD